MYSYKLLSNDKQIQKLFDDYFPYRAEHIQYLLADKNRKKYFMCALIDKEIIGVMVIVFEKHYKLSHLVVNEKHTGQGIGVGIIRTGIKSLIDIGATKIRNHKTTNVIKHTVFTDMDFKVVSYNKNVKEYNWIYELNVNENNKKIINDICEEYNVI